VRPREVRAVRVVVNMVAWLGVVAEVELSYVLLLGGGCLGDVVMTAGVDGVG
jgi:hypothetical protein